MGMVKSIFSRPKAPKITQVTQETTPTPTIDMAAQRAEDDLRLRRRRGRQSMIKTRAQDVAAPSVATKTLLGS